MSFLNHYAGQLNFLLATGVFLAVFLLIDASRRLFTRQLKKRYLTTRVPLGEHVQSVLVSVLERTSVLFELALSLLASTTVLDLPSTLEERILRLVLLVGIIQVGLWSTAVVQILINGWMDMRHGVPIGTTAAASESGKAVMRFLGKTVIWALTALLILDNIGINVNTLVAGLGFTTVAVGFATQNIVSDLFSSLSILLDKPFLVGDYIVVGDMSGTVEHIGIRTTRLKSLTGEMLVIANSDLAKSRLHNYRVMAQRRIVFNVAVPYSTAIAKLRLIPEILKKAIQSNQATQFDRATLLTFGESSLQYEVVYYVLASDYLTYTLVQQEINLGVLEAFEKASISFGSRTQVIYNAPLTHSPVLR